MKSPVGLKCCGFAIVRSTISIPVGCQTKTPDKTINLSGVLWWNMDGIQKWEYEWTIAGFLWSCNVTHPRFVQERSSSCLVTLCRTHKVFPHPHVLLLKTPLRAKNKVYWRIQKSPYITKFTYLFAIHCVRGLNPHFMCLILHDSWCSLYLSFFMVKCHICTNMPFI